MTALSYIFANAVPKLTASVHETVNVSKLYIPSSFIESVKNITSLSAVFSAFVLTAENAFMPITVHTVLRCAVLLLTDKSVCIQIVFSAKYKKR